MTCSITIIDTKPTTETMIAMILMIRAVTITAEEDVVVDRVSLFNALEW